MDIQEAIVEAQGLQKLPPPANQKKKDQSPECSKRHTMQPTTIRVTLPIAFNGVWMKSKSAVSLERDMTMDSEVVETTIHWVWM
jgi:hypothetical protein